MKLSQLLAGARVVAHQGGDPEIARVTSDSREVEPGALFVAIRGLTVDGHAFVKAALEQGASAVVVEDAGELPDGAPGAVVADTRVALALAAAALYEDPSLTFALVGITGTNGKTTTTYLVEAICREAGGVPGVIGTVGYRYLDRMLPAPHTTPDPVHLQSVFAEMRDAGVTQVAMEVSSHALEQRRVAGCHFRVAAFTNLTQDHLDFHGTMEAYFAAKKLLFTEYMAASQAHFKHALISLDDPRGADLAAASTVPVLTYSTHNPLADLRARDVVLGESGISATFETPFGAFAVRSPLVGAYNLENLLCAAGIAVALGIPPPVIANALADCRGAPGRLERVGNDRGFGIFVDYAHTGDALDRVLAAVRAHTEGRLIAVFGCGGDRDKTKRRVMGAVAARRADLVVVTSDNPRTEDPQSIIDMILRGLREAGTPELAAEAAVTEGARGFTVDADRRRAIRLAIAAARPKDAVVIAGKGHEDYQILGKTKIHFDDREEARAALEALG